MKLRRTKIVPFLGHPVGYRRHKCNYVLGLFVMLSTVVKYYYGTFKL